MASARRERGRCRDNGEDTSSVLSLSWGVMVVVVVAATMVLMCGQGVEGAPTSTNDTMVVAKTLLAGPCIHGNTTVGDQAEWTTGCNKVVCHVEPSGNYTVTHGCRGLVPSENPDDTNCVTVEDTSAAYPSCCPYLQCGAALGLTTLNPTSCYDISSTDTCQKWMELSSNCTDTTAFVYNFTLVYCQSSCGFCSGGSG